MSINLNKDKILELIQIEFDNNKSFFARKIGIKKQTLNNFFKTGIAGYKLINNFYWYCDKQKLNFKNYLDIKTKKM